MELKNQVCSLKLAKELKKLGVKQDSLFGWQVWKDLDTNRRTKMLLAVENYNYGDYYSAYTVAELGNILSKYGNYITWMTNKNKWAITRMNYMEFPELDSDTEANARAKCLIYLLKMG